MSKLLLEYIPFTFDRNAIVESMERNNGRLIVKGILQRANAKNENGRVYPRPILEREIARYKNNEVKDKRALGELDHPDSGIVNLKNVSHNIIEIDWDGDDVVGVVEILNTPSGNILKELFKSGITLGISSRGLGSVKTLHEDDSETLEVQSDFELVTFDFVSNPSTHGAFMRPMSENVNENLTSRNVTAEILIRDIICELSGVCCI